MMLEDSYDTAKVVARVTPTEEGTTQVHNDFKLHKSQSMGNLSGFSASTEPTASFSETDSVDDQRLTVSQIDSFSLRDVVGRTQRGANQGGWMEGPVLKFVNQREEDTTILEEEEEGDEDENDDILSRIPTTPQLGEENDTIVESGSHRLFPDGIPTEVTVFHHAAASFLNSSTESGETDLRKFQMYETLLASYKDKLEWSERLNNSSYEYLRETQRYAEDLLAQREELVAVIEQIENDENRRNDQELLLKGITCSSLLFYLAGGSHHYLIAAVVLQLFVAVVNLVL
jgi:hypothetical protein